MTHSDIVTGHVHRDALTGPYPPELNAVLSPDMAMAAMAEISGWPGYLPTPLIALDRLSAALGIAGLLYKDESKRLGLGSFKALGGSYAVLMLAANKIRERYGKTVSLAEIRSGKLTELLGDLTVVTATDGNHGRSVAWGAQMAGCKCRIYIHAEVSEGRKTAMEAFGAEVIRVDGNYDHSLSVCASEAAANGWFIVSDTSYDGYMTVPRDVMAGYSLMASEIAEQTRTAPPPTHVFVQAGVGGLAAAVLARLWQIYGDARPHFVIVEPDRAACVMESARQDRPMQVAIEEETMMAGLSCGEVSLLAWDVLALGASDFITIGEDQVGPAMRLLASGKAGGGPIIAGESAVPGLVGVIGVARNPALRDQIGLTADSRVLVFGCEGDTDPAIYQSIIGQSSDDDADLMAP